MKGAVLTARALEAIAAALSAALSGEEGEGDCEDVTFDDLRRASLWVRHEQQRRARKGAKAARDRPQDSDPRDEDLDDDSPQDEGDA